MANDHPLRRWREKTETTLAELAGRVGVVPSHLSQIENGDRSPSLDLAARLSDATGGDVAIADFLRPPAAAERASP